MFQNLNPLLSAAFFTLLLSACASPEPRSTEEVMSEISTTIVESFRSGDPETYLALIPSSDEVLEMYRAQKTMTDQEVEQLKNSLDTSIPEKISKSKELYFKVRSSGEAMGLDWSKITYAADRFTFTNSFETAIEGEIDVTYANALYTIQYTNCTKWRDIVIGPTVYAVTVTP